MTVKKITIRNKELRELAAIGFGKHPAASMVLDNSYSEIAKKGVKNTKVYFIYKNTSPVKNTIPENFILKLTIISDKQFLEFETNAAFNQLAAFKKLNEMQIISYE